MSFKCRRVNNLKFECNVSIGSFSLGSSIENSIHFISGEFISRLIINLYSLLRTILLEMKVKFSVLILVVILCGFFQSCHSVKGNASLQKCEFKTNKVTRVAFSGVDVLGKKSINDFQIHEGLFIASEVKNKKLTTDITMDLSVKNPNSLPADLKGIQYVLVFDGKEILNEESKNEVTIKPNGINSIPVSFRFDLLKLVEDTGYDKILNVALSLVNRNRQPASFDLYIRPHVRVNNKKIKYSDFIKLSNVYQSDKGK